MNLGDGKALLTLLTHVKNTLFLTPLRLKTVDNTMTRIETCQTESTYKD